MFRRCGDGGAVGGRPTEHERLFEGIGPYLRVRLVYCSFGWWAASHRGGNWGTQPTEADDVRASQQSAGVQRGTDSP